MTRELEKFRKFEKFVKEHFQNVENKTIDQIPGSILYTSYESLKKQDYLFMGLNPSDSPEKAVTIQESLSNTSRNGYNAYEEDWSQDNENGRSLQYGKGQHPIQLNMKHLCSLLGMDIKEICSLNLVFEPTFDANKLWTRLAISKNVMKEIERVYLPVHKEILRIVQPKNIITYGNNETFGPYWFLRELAGNEKDYKENKTMSAAHGFYSLKSFSGTINNLKVNVLGLPHLSYYKLYCGAKMNVKNEALKKYLEKYFDITLKDCKEIKDLSACS